jgi:hydrogenase/urease accessory protein HupE
MNRFELSSLSSSSACILKTFVCLVLLSLSTLVASAHDPGLSTATIQIAPGTLQITLTFAPKDSEQLLAQESSSAARNDLPKLISQEFQIELDGETVAPTSSNYHIDSQHNAVICLTLPSTNPTNLTVKSALLNRLSPGHRQYLSVYGTQPQPIAERLLRVASDTATIPVPRICETAQPPIKTAVAGFLKMGINHILTGYDHLLFLFGLLVVSSRLGSALKIITCFTVAHSITLALATLSPVPAPSRYVEPLIAASIVYIGLENLLRRGEPKGRWLLTFGFGLVHGCGFASALRELGVGANGLGVAVPLVSFNLGVELGQLCIAALVLPFLWKLRRNPGFVRQCVPACSVLIALLGGFWFVQRVWFT